jgi:hypothetical protein
MNKKVLATMAIALFLVSTLSIFSVTTQADGITYCPVCGDVSISIEPTECIAKGATVTITVTAPSPSDSGAYLHNYTISVTKPTATSKYKTFQLPCGESKILVYGTDFGTSTDKAGTYKVRVWENYWNDTLGAWCQCLVGEESFTVEAKLSVDVYVEMLMPGTMELERTMSTSDARRSEQYGRNITYCNGTEMTDPDALVIATLTSPITGRVVLSSPMEYDEDGYWITTNCREEESLYTFEWDDCSGEWTVGVTAKDSQGNNGYGATQLTLSPAELYITEFVIGYYPDCNTKNAPVPVVGYYGEEEWCFWDEHLFTRCEPVFFAAKVYQACEEELLEEGTVTVTLYTYPWNDTTKEWNFTETPTALYTIQLTYDDDEESAWYGYWTATWNIPTDATPVGYPTSSWWYYGEPRHGGVWWWANVTAADTACGDPNEGTFTTECNFAEGSNSADSDGLLPMWVTYNTPDIIIETSKAGEETTEFERCETLEITAKVRYHCCNTPFTATGGGNVSATLMAECDEESLLKTLYLNDTGAHDKDGYEIWTGTYEIKVTDPAAEDGRNWTILVHAWDNAPSPKNEKTETQQSQSAQQRRTSMSAHGWTPTRERTARATYTSASRRGRAANQSTEPTQRPENPSPLCGLR